MKKKITIEVGEYWHCLWVTGCANFIKEDPHRFALLEGVPNTKDYMYFCNTYLEACCVRAYVESNTLYSDEDVIGSDKAHFIVVGKKLKCTNE